MGENKIDGQSRAYGYEGERHFVQMVENVDHAGAFHLVPGPMAFPPMAQSSHGMF